MGKYQTGTVNVTNGSQTVIGNSTSWLANVSVGDIFKIQEGYSIYQIGAVVSNTEITLTSKYIEGSGSFANYQILADFTPNFSLTEIHVGDKDWPYHLTKTLRRIDEILYWLYDRPKSSATTTTTTTSSSSSSTCSSSSSSSSTASTSTQSSTSTTVTQSSESFYLGVNADCGYWSNAGYFVVHSGPANYIGPHDGTIKHAFMRTPSFSVIGKTITSFKIYLYCALVYSPGNVKAYLATDANPDAPTSYAECIAESLDGGSSAFAIGGVGGEISSPEMLTQLNDILGGGGWVDGNAMMVFIKWDSGTYYTQIDHDYTRMVITYN